MLCRGIIAVCSEIHTKHTSTVGSRLEMVRFMTIHFYDPCPVGPSTPDLWCITVAIQASFLYLVCFWLFSDVLVFFFSAVLLSWLWFFHPWRPSERHKRRKKSKQLTLHSFLMSPEPRPGPSSTKYKVIWLIYFFQLSVYIPNSLN